MKSPSPKEVLLAVILDRSDDQVSQLDDSKPLSVVKIVITTGASVLSLAIMSASAPLNPFKRAK